MDIHFVKVMCNWAVGVVPDDRSMWCDADGTIKIEQGTSIFEIRRVWCDVQFRVGIYENGKTEYTSWLVVNTTTRFKAYAAWKKVVKERA